MVKLYLDKTWIEQIQGRVPVVEVLEWVDSTNSACRRRFASGVRVPCLIVADQQTQGRGRLGRAWISPPNFNLYVSLMWAFNPSCSLDGLSLAVGLSFVQTLSDLGVEGLKVKWPNDLLLNDQKVAGILIEILSVGADPQMVVIGFGLNVFEPLDKLDIDQPWTCIARSQPNLADRASILVRLVDRLIVDLERFETAGWDEFSYIWPEYDALLGARLRVNQAGQLFEGVGAGVDGEGALLVQRPDGSKIPIVSADVARI